MPPSAALVSMSLSTRPRIISSVTPSSASTALLHSSTRLSRHHLFKPRRPRYPCPSAPVTTPRISATSSSYAMSTATITATRAVNGPIATPSIMAKSNVPSAVTSVAEQPAPYDYDTASSLDARRALGTYGLLPPGIDTFEKQEARALAILNSRETPIEKYQYLSVLRNTNVHLFYRLLGNNVKDLTPLIYTPTVGEACQRWSELYTQPEGMYLSFEDRGRLHEVIQNWPHEVEITVVTDGSRILGLGDLGVNGMGIPVGKLSLYTACAGIHPLRTLPLCLDLGTSNEAFRNDPLYLGSRRPKVTPEEEKEFLDEMMQALTARWPSIVIQYEDFKNPFPSLERYQNTYAMFNDDIQGTGAVILGGWISAIRQSGVSPHHVRCVFLGAGSAGVGVAKQLAEYLVKEGLSEDEARRRFWLVDSQGLVTSDRPGKLADHKVYFARDDNNGQQFRNLEEVVEYVRPTALIGLSTIGGAFTPSILSRMTQFNEHPIIFPLSNPSSKSECTFEEAIKYTHGTCLFASGSPFPTLHHNGQDLVPGQGNNMYVFPGIGLAAILSKARHVTQGMIYASGEALAASLLPEERSRNWMYPDIRRIRDVSVVVTRGVIRAAQADGVDNEPALRNLSDAEVDAYIRARMYDPFAPGRLAPAAAASITEHAPAPRLNGLTPRPGSAAGRVGLIAAQV